MNNVERSTQRQSPSARAGAHLELLLCLPLVHLHGVSVRTQRGIDDRVLVHVLKQDRLADGRPVVQARAAVTVAA